MDKHGMGMEQVMASSRRIVAGVEALHRFWDGDQSIDLAEILDRLSCAELDRVQQAYEHDKTGYHN